MYPTKALRTLRNIIGGACSCAVRLQHSSGATVAIV